MPIDYGSATFNAAITTGPPGGPAVQPPIGYDKLTAANTEMWNGHIGADQGVAVDAARMLAPGQGGYVAAPGTLGRNKAGALMTFCSSAAGATSGATGTITGSTFVAGAGTAVANSTIPAGGGGWVTN